MECKNNTEAQSKIKMKVEIKQEDDWQIGTTAELKRKTDLTSEFVHVLAVKKETVSEEKWVNEDLVSTQSPRLTSEAVSQDDSGTHTSLTYSDSEEHHQIGEEVSFFKPASMISAFGIDVNSNSSLGQNIFQLDCSPSHPCEYHSKNSDCVSEFGRDKLNHHDKRKHKCQICWKSFRYKSTLKEHIVTHSCARKFKCGSCDKSFKRKGDLKSHSVLHLAIKP